MERAVKISVGGLSPTINWKTLAKEEFALPPLKEQRRIAAVLARQDQVIDSAVSERGALDVVKRALLTSEFPHSDTRQKRVALGELLSSGSLDFQTGPFGTVLAAKEYTDAGWPIINPTDIRDGHIAHSGGAFVDEATASRLERYRMQNGDVLLARKGEIDKACIAGASHVGWIVGSDCIRLRSQQSVLSSSYLLYFLQSPRTGRMLASYAHGTVMPGLNEKMLSRLELQVPDLERQAEFVAHLTEIDAGLSRIAHRTRRAREFRQIILSNLLAATEGAA